MVPQKPLRDPLAAPVTVLSGVGPRVAETLKEKGIDVNMASERGLVMPAGVVVWSKGELAGIELMQELSWSSLMPWIREAGRRGAE